VFDDVTPDGAARADQSDTDLSGNEVAVIGMALRAPGANDVDTFWANLRGGVESIRVLTDEELTAAGVSDQRRRDPHFVGVDASLDDIKGFDATLQGFSPRDAAIMDPQHRHFIEVSWEALERAGYDPARYDGAIGIFAGSGHNAYMPYHLFTNPALMDSVGLFLVRHTSNDKDFLVTRVSYLFDLTGPAVNIQTACSTGLVAVHMGVQSLLNGESDIVLAGGSTIDLPLQQGYVYGEGEFLSTDGHCRAFDAAATGTVFGNGAGVVVLKRLDEALADGDNIHAVVRGSAINNDGSNKVGYLAPSVDGQAAAVGEAIALSGVDAGTIGFVECHGTGTEIGDPIEVAALTQSFRAHTDAVEFCALGSVKTNVGHLDTAAGVASFIKTCLALEHGEIPPTLHFREPNPRLELETSPFFVSGDLREWPALGGPRRAGVSSIGVGGTNAHAVLEEPPERPPTGSSRRFQLLALSAKGPGALDAVTERFADFLERRDDVDLADVAYTLRVGRRELERRRFAVVSDHADAASVLRGDEPSRLVNGVVEPKRRRVVFMFPGQGAQYADMGRDLYETEPVFRTWVDRCADILTPLLGLDIRDLLYPSADAKKAADEQLAQTAITQPATFTIEYAMAKLLMSWGVQPDALIGHSLGEYTAACVAEVFSLEDALQVVATRGRLMQPLGGGSMMAIPQSEDVVRGYLTDEVSFAARNGPEFCVVAGPDAAVDELEARLEADEVPARRLLISIASHSPMMDPMLAPFAAAVAETSRNEPKIPYVSNVTGTWITPDQIGDPDAWAQHIRQPVDFVGGLRTILESDTEPVLIEVGPGRTLATFARQLDGPHRSTISTSMRHPGDDADDLSVVLTTMGELWTAGAIDDWSSFHGDERRHRVPLPTYPFQHEEYWIEPGKQVHDGIASTDLSKRADITDWYYEPVWNETQPSETDGTVDRWLVMLDDEGVGVEVAELLRVGADVVTVARGAAYEVDGAHFVIDPEQPDHYAALIRELASADRLPDGVAYLWPLSSAADLDPVAPSLAIAEAAAFYGQLFLAQAFAAEGATEPLHWWAVTNRTVSVAGETDIHPLQALALGPVRVLGREYPHIRAHHLDIDSPTPTTRHHRVLVDRLTAELQGCADDAVVAHRGSRRFVQGHEPRPRADACDSVLRDGGVYLITGGLGGLGLEVAEHLAGTLGAHLVLVSRSELPPSDQWDEWLDGHPADDPTSRTLRRLQTIERAGGGLMVAAADVGDLAQMSTVVDRAVERFGAIHGVVHAAGRLDDGLVSLKTREQAAAVLSPKVKGTLVLERALDGIDLDLMVLFSSISATAGIAGQIDYAAANAFMDAYADHCMARTGRVTVAVGWGPWRSVGMTVRTAAELGLIDDRSRARDVAHPWLDHWYERADGDVFDVELAGERAWVLDEHRVRDDVLMPGSGFMELAAAAQSARTGGAVEIRDVVFMAPLILAGEQAVTLRIRIDDDGAFAIASGRSGDEREYVRGHVGVLDSTPGQPIDLEAIRARCDGNVREFDRYTLRHVEWGPRWNNLRSVAYGDREALARVELPAEFTDDLAAHPLHAALLDLATAGAPELIPGYDHVDDFYVPFSYGCLRQHRALTAELCSHIRYRPSDDPDIATFDVAVADPEGNLLVEVDRFVMRRAAGEISQAADPQTAPTQLDPLLESLENAIEPDEGVLALDRVLSVHTPARVSVVAQDLRALIHQASDAVDRDGSDATGEMTHARPDLSSAYVEPETDRERAIAAIWEEMLGVEDIGVHDDFFELGGHSLLLTQAITRVRKLSTADVPLVTLFEATTIKALADLLEAADEDGGEPAEAAPALGRVARDAYRTSVDALQGKPTT
jgi:acyl transferase domain-containing protein